jgi:hypothetical protein
MLGKWSTTSVMSQPLTFLFMYFVLRQDLINFSQASSNLRSSCLCLLSSWDYSYALVSTVYYIILHLRGSTTLKVQKLSNTFPPGVHVLDVLSFDSER